MVLKLYLYRQNAIIHLPLCHIAEMFRLLSTPMFSYIIPNSRQHLLSLFPFFCILPPASILTSPLCAAMADHFTGVVSSANLSGSQTKEIYGAVITITIIATVAVILRIVARRKSEASLSYDDYSIVLALVGVPPFVQAYSWNTSLIKSLGLSLWSQYKYNRCCSAMGPGKTFLHPVKRSTSPFSKSNYHLVPFGRANITLIRFIASTV